MRKPLVLLLLMLWSAPGPALAGPYATEITQVLNHVELVLQYAVQANQLATQIKMLTDALKNSVKNPNTTVLQMKHSGVELFCGYAIRARPTGETLCGIHGWPGESRRAR